MTYIFDWSGSKKKRSDLSNRRFVSSRTSLAVAASTVSPTSTNPDMTGEYVGTHVLSD